MLNRKTYVYKQHKLPQEYFITYLKEKYYLCDDVCNGVGYNVMVWVYVYVIFFFTP